MNVRLITPWAGLGLAFASFLPPSAQAGEGGFSNYFAGAYGSILPALAPEPGFTFVSQNYYFAGSVGETVLNGRVEANVESVAYFSYFTGVYTWDLPDWGGRFSVVAAIPIAYTDVSAKRTGPGPGGSDSGNTLGSADSGWVPASYFWSSGNWHFNTYLSVVAPTGYYDVNDIASLGRNHWSFDTVFATTYFDPERGFEISVVPGYFINTKNHETDYRSGNEFHVDWMVNKLFDNGWVVGLQGYALQQVTGDSGSGAKLGAYKGQSWGLGPMVSYIPPSLGGKFAISAKFIRDVATENRFESDYGVLTLAWTF